LSFSIPLRYFLFDTLEKKLIKKFIIVSDVKNLETDECPDVYSYLMAKS